MGLQLIHTIELPTNLGPGGFDHADIHRASGRLYVAHTINHALDVIDCATDRYLHSIPNLTGVAGALVSAQRALIFTSNRGENTVSVFQAGSETETARVPVGLRPNGLAFDAGRGHLLAANVGDPAVAGSFTLSVVDVVAGAVMASIAVPGRTRWAVFDAQADAFYVNISDPALIVVVEGRAPHHVARTLPVPAAGPHGLDLDIDAKRRRLFCACDAKQLVTVDPQTGQVPSVLDLSGTPDVIFFNPALKHLYVAIGDPGVIDVFDTAVMQRLETVVTEKGAHTLAFDADRNKVYAFAPQTHRALVFVDRLPPTAPPRSAQRSS